MTNRAKPPADRRVPFPAAAWGLLLALAWCGGCGGRETDGAGAGAGVEHDLVVAGATLFHPETRGVAPGQTVVVDGGVITVVGPDDSLGTTRGRRRIEAGGRLLTPGFIDVHHHLGSVLADSTSPGGGEITRLVMEPDSLAAYRRRWGAAYLPYGVTAVRGAGDAERDLPLLVALMERHPAAPDFYPCGGALISEEEGRTPYVGHVALADPAAAREKVEVYCDLGFRHIKLYWRLREPEFDAALDEAQLLGMSAFGHIDYKVVSIAHALDMGLRDFEHALTLLVEVMAPEDFDPMWALPWLTRARERNRGLYFTYATEIGNFVGPDNPRMLALIDRLREERATVTPTLHLFAQRLGLTYFTTPPAGDFDDMSGLSAQELARAREGYAVLAGYVRALHEKGIRLNLGTDSRDPGRAALSELLLLHAAGIPMPDVLGIATLNGARTLGGEDLYGTIAPGKRANCILFEKSPLDDPGNLLSPKRVIKDGVEWGADAPPR
jgi:imidazolonepropionase-like amidohydrolase